MTTSLDTSVDITDDDTTTYDVDEVVAANRALVRRVFDEIVNGRDLDLIDELYRPDMIDHDPLPGAPEGSLGVRYTLGGLQTAFSDLHVQIEAMSAHGDKVVIHNTWSGTHDGSLLGLPPTHRFTRYAGIVIFRVEDGLMAERWALVDTASLAGQIQGSSLATSIGARPRRRRPRS